MLAYQKRAQGFKRRGLLVVGFDEFVNAAGAVNGALSDLVPNRINQRILAWARSGGPRPWSM
jgi:hypothetical protein